MSNCRVYECNGTFVACSDSVTDSTYEGVQYFDMNFSKNLSRKWDLNYSCTITLHHVIHIIHNTSIFYDNLSLNCLPKYTNFQYSFF